VLTNLSLFSGAGGLDLGARLVGGFRTVAYVEYDRYAQGVLMSRMRSGDLDDAPIFEDVRTFDGRRLRGGVDVVSGGFPCQDVSRAHSGSGIGGGRSGLYGQQLRIVCEVGANFVLLENVAGLFDDGGLGVVLGDLAELGYDAEWSRISACAVGAPHALASLPC
jgi:DNA (cytosine-5)-methyltransferase 1